ncbi:MAG: anti-sigma factor [Acidimicrobiia bacterium]
MNHEDAQELLGAYALDAVDGDELGAVERHLDECARCRAEVAEHREVVVLLAHGGADAPDGLWDRIAGSLEAAPPPVDLAAFAARPRRSVLSGVGVALAAAAVLAVVLGIQVRDQANRIDQLETAMEDPAGPGFDAALDDPSSELFELASDDGAVVVRGAITGSGIGYLRATGLPALAAGQTYQLWGAAGTELVSLGVLGADPGVVTFRDAGYGQFAITAEDRPGGVVSSSKPAVVQGSRTA